MSSNKIRVSLNKNNEKEIIDPECERVSLQFVDTVFEDVKTKVKDGTDPLNIKRNSVSTKDKKVDDLKTPQKKTYYNQSNTKKIHHTHSSADKFINNAYKNQKKNNNNYQKYGISKNNTKKSGRLLKNSFGSINENFKAKQESEKEKKLYQEKVRLLENRIFALKNQEDEMNRKMHCNEIRQNYLNKKKKEKSDFKQTLLSYDIDKRNELDEKRRAIKEQKNQLNKELKDSMQKTKISKMRNYKKLQNEKKMALTIISQNNHKFEKNNKKNIDRIKKQRERIKQNELKKQRKHGKSMDNYYLESCEDNKIETDKLKDKIKKLEKLELKYINSINQTKKGLPRNNSVGVYFFQREITPIQKLDLEEIDNKYYNNKKNFHRNENIHRSYGNNEIIYDDENENDDIIKVDKRIGLK